MKVNVILLLPNVNLTPCAKLPPSYPFPASHLQPALIFPIALPPFTTIKFTLSSTRT